MATSYSRILSRPGAIQFSLAGLIARFPMSMVGISTILAVQELYESYQSAGIVSSASVVAAAVGSPLLARLVDRHGQAKVMMPSTIMSATALAGLSWAASIHAPIPTLAALAVVSGGLSGSIGSLVRSRWTALLDTPADIHTAFSLEAALDEVAFILGPIIATTVCTLPGWPVISGWIVALILQVGGSMWFLSQRSTEPPAYGTAQARRRRAWLSRAARRPSTRSLDTHPVEQGGDDNRATYPTQRPVLRYGAVIAVIMVFAFSGALFGANDVTAVAFADEQGNKSAAGLILAAWALGSLTAALIYGARSWRWSLSRQLLTGTVAFAVGVSTFMFAPSLHVLAILMVLSGAAIAPTITTGNSIVQATVAPSQLTEGLAWVGTAINVGVSVGSLVGGIAVDHSGSTGGYTMVTIFAWSAVLCAVLFLPILRRSQPHHDLTPPPHNPHS